MIQFALEWRCGGGGAVVPSSPMTEPSVLAPAAPSNEDLASAAARRRQRILDQGNSRMNRIMGGHRSSSQDTRKVEQATSTPFNYNTVSSEAVASVDNVVAASPDNAATDVTISATVPSPSPLSTSSSEATATKAKSECAIEPPPSRAPSTVTLPLPSKVATAYPQVRPTIALSRGMKLVVLCLTALLVRLSGNPDVRSINLDDISTYCWHCDR